MKPVKLSRPAQARNLLVRNLATSILLYEKVQTTPTKARAAQMQVDRLITTAKHWLVCEERGIKLVFYRKLISETSDKLAVKKLTEVLAGRFAKRSGGYTRRIKIAPRLGDGAQQVIVMLTERSAGVDKKLESNKTKVKKADEISKQK